TMMAAVNSNMARRMTSRPRGSGSPPASLIAAHQVPRPRLSTWAGVPDAPSGAKISRDGIANRTKKNRDSRLTASKPLRSVRDSATRAGESPASAIPAPAGVLGPTANLPVVLAEHLAELLGIGRLVHPVGRSATARPLATFPVGLDSTAPDGPFGANVVRNGRSAVGPLGTVRVRTGRGPPAAPSGQCGIGRRNQHDRDEDAGRETDQHRPDLALALDAGHGVLGEDV